MMLGPVHVLFFKGAEEFVVPRTGNEKCVKHGVLALIA